MRPFARQSARLATHTRATSRTRLGPPSTPRPTAPQQLRPFTNSVARPSDAQPPNGSRDRDGRVEEQQEEQRRIESGVGSVERSNDGDSGGAQPNGDGRKVGMRRTLRGRRLVDVPKPPPIPDWFLEQNVVLVKGDLPEHSFNRGRCPVLRCVDAKTGHTLFTVPYYNEEVLPVSPQTRTVISLNGTTVDITTLQLDGEYLNTVPDSLREKLVVAALIDQRSQPPELVDSEALTELLVALPAKIQKEVLRVEAENRRAEERRRGSQSSVRRDAQAPDPKVRANANSTSGSTTTKSSAMAHDFFSQKPAARTPTPGSPERGEQTYIEKLASAADFHHPLAFVLLEVEASARASLALPRQAQLSSSFASSRVDLSLVCPDPNSHAQMDHYVDDLAQVLHADIIRLDTNDVEDLTAEYVGQGQDSPGSFSTLGYDVFEGYQSSHLNGNRVFASAADEAEDFDVGEDDPEEGEGQEDAKGPPINLEVLRKALYERRHELSKALGGIGISGISIGTPKLVRDGNPGKPYATPARQPAASDAVQWDDARLGALFEGVLDAAKQKRAAQADTKMHADTQQSPTSVANPSHDRLTQSTRLLMRTLSGYVGQAGAPLIVEPQESGTAEQSAANPSPPRTIIHIKDLKDICRSRLGDAIIKKLVRVVQKRRRAGESVLIVGTTAQEAGDSFASSGLPTTEDSPFRTITIPPLFKSVAVDTAYHEPWLSKTWKDLGYHRILDINLRHIQSMLRRVGQNTELNTPQAREQLALPGTRILTTEVLSLDIVQRIVLVALGLKSSYAASDAVQPIHIALATYVTMRATQTIRDYHEEQLDKQHKARSIDTAGPGSSRVDQIRAVCNAHETKLLTGVVDAQNIRTTFDDVHAPKETIDALKTVTSLSLLRPEAFSYGVLASDRLPGLLLYGPPGTGKTMLAKAVAKESQATVLEVSGAQIYEKYVGEGEKMVRAVFSLAKKLTPCVVFIDEADAIFGSRNQAGSRNTHREIINQFLREWDGMDDHSVFMMVATNRPFDLDDAVLRRLPRRLLLDLPVAKDRESILGIHLKNEVLDPAVSLAKLAEQTPLYSGSDLKNLCVSAALACVREENDLATLHNDDKAFKLPEKRTLMVKHFEKAVAEISASISEDMSSLVGIRKFDEQYGDRRGRRKKAGYGFGLGESKVEGEGRVRPMEGQGLSPAV